LHVDSTFQFPFSARKGKEKGNISSSSMVFEDFMMRLKMGKRIHLCEYETDNLAEGLNSLFESEVDIPRIMYGKKQTLDTLISEEALLFAKFLRNETKEWKPRTPILN
jgi:hypothetical protein